MQNLINSNTKKEVYKNDDFHLIISKLCLADLLLVKIRSGKKRRWKSAILVINALDCLYCCNFCQMYMANADKLIEHLSSKRHIAEISKIRRYYHPIFTYEHNSAFLESITALNEDFDQYYYEAIKFTTKSSTNPKSIILRAHCAAGVVEHKMKEKGSLNELMGSTLKFSGLKFVENLSNHEVDEIFRLFRNESLEHVRKLNVEFVQVCKELNEQNVLLPITVDKLHKKYYTLKAAIKRSSGMMDAPFNIKYDDFHSDKIWPLFTDVVIVLRLLGFCVQWLGSLGENILALLNFVITFCRNTVVNQDNLNILTSENCIVLENAVEKLTYIMETQQLSNEEQILMSKAVKKTSYLLRHAPNSKMNIDTKIYNDPNLKSEISSEKNVNSKTEIPSLGNTSSIPISKISDVISVLRKLASFEKKLGSLGSKIVELLSCTISLNKSDAAQANSNCLTFENCILLETAIETLKGIIETNQSTNQEEKAIKELIKQASEILQNAFNDPVKITTANVNSLVSAKNVEFTPDQESNTTKQQNIKNITSNANKRQISSIPQLEKRQRIEQNTSLDITERIDKNIPICPDPPNISNKNMKTSHMPDKISQNYNANFGNDRSMGQATADDRFRDGNHRFLPTEGGSKYSANRGLHNMEERNVNSSSSQGKKGSHYANNQNSALFGTRNGENVLSDRRIPALMENTISNELEYNSMEQGSNRYYNQNQNRWNAYTTPYQSREIISNDQVVGQNTPNVLSYPQIVEYPSNYNSGKYMMDRRSNIVSGFERESQNYLNTNVQHSTSRSFNEDTRERERYYMGFEPINNRQNSYSYGFNDKRGLSNLKFY